MAVCPKCGRKLKITDLKPECPGCGVNLLYYKIEESLEVDAINAELEHAKTQKRIDRAKAAMVGSPFTIIRIVLLVLAVGMFFLPLGTMHTVGPYFEQNTTINALEVYNGVSSLDFDGLFTMFSSPLLGKSFIFFAIAVVGVALSAVCALLELICSFLSCSPKGFVRNVILSVLGIVAMVVAIVFYSMFVDNIVTVLPGIIDGGVSFGAYCVIAAFALVLGINIFIKVKGVNVKYKQSFVDSVPYEEFVERFENKKYDLASLEAIKPELETMKPKAEQKA